MIYTTLEKNIDPALLKGRATKLERALTIQIHKDTDEFVPALTKSLAQRSHTIANRIIYPGPYARYLHEGKVMVNSKSGKAQCTSRKSVIDGPTGQSSCRQTGISNSTRPSMPRPRTTGWTIQGRRT